MNTANVGAGRLERRVRPVGRETMPGFLVLALCLCMSFGGSHPCIRPTALVYSKFQCFPCDLHTYPGITLNLLKQSHIKLAIAGVVSFP